MKILLASILPIEDITSWSGIPFHIREQLSKRHDVFSCYSKKAHQLQKRIAQKSRLMHSLSGKRLNVYHHSKVARIYGQALSEEIEKHQPDLIVCLGSGTEVLNIETTVPTYLVADATLDNLLNSYELYSKFSGRSISKAKSIETSAFKKFDKLFFTSHWARQSCVEAYPNLTKKVFPINFGSNLKATQWNHSKDLPNSLNQLKLLTVGKEYTRKGIDRCKAIAEKIGCQLTVIGIDKQLNKENPEDVRQLSQLYQEAHYFLLMSRADCTPIVINEASSFGLPCIATDVGGIKDIIEGNGEVVDSIEAATSFIESTNSVKYQHLRSSTRSFYEKNLTWQLFEDRLLA